MRAGVLGVLGALMMAPTVNAVASRGWTMPQVLWTGSTPGTPALAFDARGWAFSSWPTVGERQQSASRPPSAAAFRRPRGAPFSGEGTVEAPPPAPVVDDSGGVITLQQRRIGDTCGLATLYRLVPRFGRVNGEFARAHGGWTILSHTIPPAVALAGNGRGTAVAAWIQMQRRAHGGCMLKELVRVAVRAPGQAFDAPVTVAHGASSGAIAAAVARDGAILVAWRYGQVIDTRLRSPAGRWGPTRSVKSGPVDAFAAASGPNGATYLLWTETQPMGPPEAARVVGGAVCAASSMRCNATILERGTWPIPYEGGAGPEMFAVRLALTRGGALAAWNDWVGGHLRVQTATATDGGFGRARSSTPAGQTFTLGALAVSPAGRPALAVMGHGPFVAFGSSDGSFGAPEAVGPAGPRAVGEALAFSPLTGRPTLVWTSYAPEPSSTAVLASTGP